MALANELPEPTIPNAAHARAVRARWLDVFRLSVAGSGVVAVVGWQVATCRRLLTVSPLLVACGAFVSVVVWYWSSRPSPHLVTVLGLRHVATYPPSWVPALGGTALVLGGAVAWGLHGATGPCSLDSSDLDAWRRTNGAYAIAALAASVFVTTIGVAWSKRFAARRERALAAQVFGAPGLSSPAVAASALAADFALQQKWFLDDAPSGDPALNAFDHAAVARRLAGHFVARSKPSVALVGRVGSGKTTILRLAVHDLLQTNRIGRDVVVVRVSLWPFDTVDAAIRGVLESVSTALSQHISTLPLLGLPSRYAEAVQGLHPTASLVGRLLTLSHNPPALLRVFDDAACAAGVRTILWVEDLERFSGLHASAASDAAERSRLSSLRALMNELADCASMQVVLSASAASQRFDFEKFARYVEGVPPVDARDVFAILQTFRRECLAAYPDDIDPAAASVRREFLKEEGPQFFELVSALNRGLVTAQRALAILCDTPRTLKFALRDCFDAWTALHGEVDFDDLLTVSILGAAEPHVKAILIDHMIDFRYGIDPKKKDGEAKPEVERALESALAGANGTRRRAVERVLLMLFPHWRVGRSSASTDKPQGFAATHSAYWTRYLRRQPPPESESDQRLLRLIDEWRRKVDVVSLPALLASEGGDERTVKFLAVCAEPEIRRLVLEVTQAEVTRSPEAWRFEHYAFGVGIVRSLVVTKPISDASALQTAVLDSMALCWPNRLPVAFSLAYLFSKDAPEVASPLSREQHVEVLTAFRESMLRAYVGHPDALASSLENAAMEILYYSCQLAGVLPKRDVPSPEWDALSSTIVEATEQSPDVMAPQLALFVAVTEEHPVGGRFPAHFDRDRASLFFDVDRILAAVARASRVPVTDSAVPHYEALLAEAARAARSG